MSVGLRALSILTGGLVGGIGGVATGENYDSTALIRNFAGGAAAGLGAATLGNLAISKMGARGLGRLTGVSQGIDAWRGSAGTGLRNRVSSAARGALKSPVGGVFRTAGLAGRLGAGAVAFAAKHPRLAGGAAASIGGAVLISNSVKPNRVDLENDQLEPLQSRSRFQNSATGLTFGLHRKRHR